MFRIARSFTLGISLVLLAGLTGCSGGDPDPSRDTVSSASLCVSSSCGERLVLMDLPGAENQIFTSDGRLFVSGGSAVYEIKRDADGTYQKTPITDEVTGFTGLAIRNNILYAASGSGRLFAGEISAKPLLKPIFNFSGMCIPNGMSLGPDGKLYVVDEPLNFCVPDPKIVRLTLDASDPMKVTSQETWVSGTALGTLFVGVGNTQRLPNGLTRIGNRFFGTDGGSIYSVDLQYDGSAGTVTPLFFEPTAHDEISIAGDALLTTDFFAGRLLLLSQDGRLLQETDRLLFFSPSSAKLGRPPLFEEGDIVVTETGVLGDQNLPVDKLSLFRRRR